MQLKIPGETALISLAVHEFADIFVIFVNKFSADGCFLGTVDNKIVDVPGYVPWLPALCSEDALDLLLTQPPR